MLKLLIKAPRVIWKYQTVSKLTSATSFIPAVGDVIAELLVSETCLNRLTMGWELAKSAMSKQEE